MEGQHETKQSKTAYCGITNDYNILAGSADAGVCTAAGGTGQYRFVRRNLAAYHWGGGGQAHGGYEIL